MNSKTVIVPNKDGNGYVIGTKSIVVEWKCPVCSQEMGEPRFWDLVEDGAFYPINIWDNPCGHVVEYDDLKV